MILLGSEDDGADLIIGKIVKYHIQDDVYFGDSKIDAKQLKPVARLAGNDYAKLGEQFTIERPSNDNWTLTMVLICNFHKILLTV